jgi:DNA-binding MarR family transcriptional regulator
MGTYDQNMERHSNRHLMVGVTLRGLQLLTRELGLDLFSQPALEMLFHLYAKPDGPPCSLTGLTSVSSTSERNSQRIVHRMVKEAMVRTGPDDCDGRRTIVDLTDGGRQAIDRFLDDWATSAEVLALLDRNSTSRR